MPDLIGQTIGRYRILEQLGQGGMATVYKAYDTRLDRDVAIKVIRKAAFPPERLEQLLKRFEREAKALARLIHPNIVSVIDYGEYEGSPYLVMPYLLGGTLKQRLGKQVPWQEAARLLLPVASALDYAHRRGIVHRDVKASNILITDSGEPMLTDFGIAKLLESNESTALTGTGMGVGTPEYMAPEQWSGQVTPQSDIYSLGVVFYEMITGRKPYTADTPSAILLKQATEPLPRPAKYVHDLPEAVEKVLLRMLAKDPQDRYADMGALMEGVDALLLGQSKAKQAIPSSALSRPESGGSTQTLGTVSQSESELTYDQGATRQEPPPMPSQPVPPPAPVRPAKKKTWWIWLAGLGGFACLAAIVILVLLLTHGPQNYVPAASDTNRPSAYPSVPPTIAVSPPKMYNFQACLTPCYGANSQSSFPAQTTKIYFQWQYEDIPADSTYLRFITQAGKSWAHYQCAWPNASSGTENVTFTEPGGIQSGDWVLTVEINGAILLQETINVQGNFLYWSPAGDFTTCYGKR